MTKRIKSCHPRQRYALAFITLLAAAAVSGCSSEPAVPSLPEQAIAIPGKGINVYAAGDIANCHNRRAEHTGAAKTAGLIEKRLQSDPSAIVLALGDSTYPVGLPREFTTCYEPTWGRFRSRTYPAPGNHEYYSPQAFGYYNYFDTAAGPQRRGYYSFRIGKWHVVSLNSNLAQPEHQAQLDWLKADLEKNKTLCTLAFWHHPRYSSGGHGSNAKMGDAWEALQAAGAELVLSSHDHDYERFAPQDTAGERDDRRGIRQFVVGTGGARLTPFYFIKPHSEARDNSAHGVLRLTLKATGYEWEFLPVKDSGFSDRGAALCR